MTETDGAKFVETVLQTGWPNWKFTDQAVRGGGAACAVLKLR